MASETEVDMDGVAADGGIGDEESQPRRRKFAGKTITLFVVLPLLLVAGAGAGAYFGGFLDSLLGLETGEAGEEERKPVVYYDLPEILVNLSGRGKKNTFLRLKVALELDEGQDIEELEKILPRIIDNFQVYLRELRLEDLNGSAGVFRLKEELLIRVNTSVQPLRVNDVLFKEMIVQ